MQHTSPPVKKVTAKKPRRLKWILLITALIIASPFLIHYGTIELHRWQMRSYLEDKYNEKFKIGSVVYSGGGFGVEGSWQSNDAHPESSDDTKFYIGCNSHGCSDQYVAVLWSAQATRDANRTLSSTSTGSKVKVGSMQIKVVLTGNVVNSVDKSSRYEDFKNKENGVKHLILLSMTSLGDSAAAALTDEIIKILLAQGVRHDKIDINVSSDGGVCRAYNLPVKITSDFISKCNNSKLEWYNGN